MYQQITWVGNIGKAPETRMTPGGKMVTSISVAVNKRYKTAAGETKEKTLWARVSAWERLAEFAATLQPGTPIMVVGEIENLHGYMTREGAPAASLEITAQTLRVFSKCQTGAETDVQMPF